MQPPSPVYTSRAWTWFWPYSRLLVVSKMTITFWPNQTRPGGTEAGPGRPDKLSSRATATELAAAFPYSAQTLPVNLPKQEPKTQHTSIIERHTHTIPHAHISTNLPSWKLRGLCFVRELSQRKNRNTRNSHTRRNPWLCVLWCAV